MRIKQRFSSWGWKAFIYFSEYTEEEYFECLYEQEKRHREMNHIPDLTPIRGTIIHWERIQNIPDGWAKYSDQSNAGFEFILIIKE